jgi:hypothetical protein
MFLRRSLPLLLLLVSWTLSACALYLPTSAPATQPALYTTPPAVEPATPALAAAPSATPSPTAVAAATTAATATAVPPLPNTQYNLQVQFDYSEHSLQVNETIHYTNQTGVVLPDLLLVVRPLRWEGSFRLTSLAWEGGEPITDAEADDYLLRIPLPQALEAGGQISLQLSYELRLPYILPPEQSPRPLPYGYTERQTNLVDWYPYLPPYRPGEGWLAHEPGYFGEYLVYDLADYQVQITLAEAVPGLVLTGSAPAIQEGLVTTFDLPAGRAFAWSASPQYQVLTTSVGETVVSSYYFPYHPAAGQAALDATAQALSLYNELLGPYPRPSLSVVEADFLDGMEYSGLYFLSRGFYDLYDGTPRGYLTAIAAHETAHQWWFDQVGNDQALEPWLDEALCTYMERLFYERMEAETPSTGGQPLVDWWWYFRVNFYEPTGPVGGTIYDFGSFRAYRDAVYLNGALFLEALRLNMGDEAFFAFLRDYATQMSGHQATAEDFFTLLSQYAGSNLDELRDTYFSP